MSSKELEEFAIFASTGKLTVTSQQANNDADTTMEDSNGEMFPHFGFSNKRPSPPPVPDKSTVDAFASLGVDLTRIKWEEDQVKPAYCPTLHSVKILKAQSLAAPASSSNTVHIKSEPQESTLNFYNQVILTAFI